MAKRLHFHFRLLQMSKVANSWQHTSEDDPVSPYWRGYINEPARATKPLFQHYSHLFYYNFRQLHQTSPPRWLSSSRSSRRQPPTASWPSTSVAVTSLTMCLPSTPLVSVLCHGLIKGYELEEDIKCLIYANRIYTVYATGWKNMSENSVATALLISAKLALRNWWYDTADD